MLGISIWTYQGPKGVSELVDSAAEKVLQVPKEIVPLSVVWLPILALYTPVHLFCLVVVLTFCIFPASFAAALWTGTLTLYYILTLQGTPHHTG